MNIAVDRDNQIAAAKSLIRARQAIKKGWSIGIFPEGTIPSSVPEMIPFKSGAFKLAIDAQVPIVPVTFLNNWKLMSEPSNTFGPASPGIAKAIIHEPLETKGLTNADIDSLSERVFEVISQPLQGQLKKPKQ